MSVGHYTIIRRIFGVFKILVDTGTKLQLKTKNERNWAESLSDAKAAKQCDTCIEIKESPCQGTDLRRNYL